MTKWKEFFRINFNNTGKQRDGERIKMDCLVLSILMSMNVLDIWLEDTPFKEMDAYHVIAGSAFGELYVLVSLPRKRNIYDSAFICPK